MIVALVAVGTLLTLALGSAMRRRQKPEYGAFDPKSSEYLAMLARIEASQSGMRGRGR